MPPPGPRVCPAQLDVHGITFLLARVSWSRSFRRISGSAGMLSGKIWTFALGPVLPMCTYKIWFARPADRNARSVLDLALSMRCMHRFLRFRMGCQKLPRDTGCLLGVPRQDRICMMCQQGVLGDEKHLVF